MTYRRHRTPQRQYKAVKVKDWGRSLGFNHVQKFVKKLREFDLIQRGTVVANGFSDACYWSTEGKAVELLTRGKLHSEAYKHYNTVEEIRELVDSEDVKEFSEVFP